MTITKRKNAYRIRVSQGYDSHGKHIMKSMTYHPKPNMSEAQAQKEAYRQGIIFEEKCRHEQIEPPSPIFSQVADEWLEMEEKTQNLKPSTIVRLKGLKERTYDYLGSTPVNDISYKQIQQFVLFLSKSLSQKTQKHYITFISDVMRYALKCDLIRYNPCKDIQTVKTTQKDMNPYSLQEIQRLLFFLRTEAPLKYQVFFYLMVFTGMRRGEVLGLEYGDISDDGVLTVRRTSNYQTGLGTYTGSPKTKSSQRQLYLQPELVDLIKRLQVEQSYLHSDRLFVTESGSPMHPNTPYTWLERFCKAHNIIFKGVHAFRHFVATQALSNGVNLKAVSAMLGHSQTSTTINIYIHNTDEINQQALNSVAGSIASS